jgi:CrcB protein
MKHILFIALGGAGGALARYWLAAWVHNSAQSHFPWGTLLVNALGSFAIGFAYILIVERGAIHPDWRSVFMVGFLGAFTTFSTFSLETLALFENGQGGLAVLYVTMSVLACLLSAWGGATITRMM